MRYDSRPISKEEIDWPLAFSASRSETDYHRRGANLAALNFDTPVPSLSLSFFFSCTATTVIHILCAAFMMCDISYISWRSVTRRREKNWRIKWLKNRNALLRRHIIWGVLARRVLESRGCGSNDNRLSSINNCRNERFIIYNPSRPLCASKVIKCTEYIRAKDIRTKDDEWLLQ